MTRAARRATTLLLAVLTAVTLAAVLLASPAMATEGAEESDDHSTEAAADGFGAGQWDGLLLAAAFGVILGGITFAMSKPGEIHRVDEHH